MMMPAMSSTASSAMHMTTSGLLVGLTSFAGFFLLLPLRGGVRERGVPRSRSHAFPSPSAARAVAAILSSPPFWRRRPLARSLAAGRLDSGPRRGVEEDESGGVKGALRGDCEALSGEAAPRFVPGGVPRFVPGGD